MIIITEASSLLILTHLWYNVNIAGERGELGQSYTKMCKDGVFIFRLFAPLNFSARCICKPSQETQKQGGNRGVKGSDGGRKVRQPVCHAESTNKAPLNLKLSVFFVFRGFTHKIRAVFRQGGQTEEGGVYFTISPFLLTVWRTLLVIILRD